MRIFPPPLEIGETEGFTKEKDIFGRAPIGNGLTNLVTKVADPMVIAVDGQWGSGKTVFLKMWAGHLRKEGFPVVYYLEDAFTAIAAELIALADELKKANTPAAKKFLKNAIGAGKVILRRGLKLSAKVATMGALEAADFENVAEDIAKEAAEFEDKYLGELLTKQREKKDALQSFREALADLPKLLANTDDQSADVPVKPLVIIIDELDRCRPIFALQILERVKHFFTVPGVHFVLGTHVAQLCNSVTVTYGAKIDAQTYLQKFIHLTLHLVDTAHYQSEHISTKYIEHLIREMQFPESPATEMTKRYIHHVAQRRSLSLRTIERILTALAISLAFKPNNVYAPTGIVLGLCVLKVTNPEVYVKAKIGLVEWTELMVPLGFSNEADVEDKSTIEGIAKHWRYCTSAAAKHEEELKEFGRPLWQYDMQPDEVVPYVVRNVVDRLTPSQ